MDHRRTDERGEGGNRKVQKSCLVGLTKPVWNSVWNREETSFERVEYVSFPGVYRNGTGYGPGGPGLSGTEVE